MDEQDRDKIIHRAARRIADDLGCTVAEVNALGGALAADGRHGSMRLATRPLRCSMVLR
jgi:hypothetical protein